MILRIRREGIPSHEREGAIEKGLQKIDDKGRERGLGEGECL